MSWLLYCTAAVKLNTSDVRCFFCRNKTHQMTAFHCLQKIRRQKCGDDGKNEEQSTEICVFLSDFPYFSWIIVTPKTQMLSLPGVYLESARLHPCLGLESDPDS